MPPISRTTSCGAPLGVSGFGGADTASATTGATGAGGADRSTAGGFAGTQLVSRIPNKIPARIRMAGFATGKASWQAIEGWLLEKAQRVDSYQPGSTAQGLYHTMKHAQVAGVDSQTTSIAAREGRRCWRALGVGDVASLRPITFPIKPGAALVPCLPQADIGCPVGTRGTATLSPPSYAGRTPIPNSV